MDRRSFIAAALVAPLAGTRPAVARAPRVGWRRFELTTRVTLLDSSGPARLWLPVAQSAGDYQSVSQTSWTCSGRTALVHDMRYGAGLLRADWSGGGAWQHIELVQEVATRDREVVAAVLTQADRRLWTQPSGNVPVDGIVRDTAAAIIAGRTAPRDRLRALYDWVVDNTWRNPNTPGCGSGDVRTMLRTGDFGGKCADINGLMVALARAAGFPARDVYGIRVAGSRLFPALGRSGDISKAQHCRAEMFLDGEGWFPLDPADVRKVVLEEEMPLESDAVRALRDRLFGRWEMNWVGFNSATDIALPGAWHGQRPNFPFLMYPCAFTAAGQPDCLDPTEFRYEIRSRELISS